jgi:hypothetical protein
MIGVRENKNIGEKNIMGFLKNTGILSDESGLKNTCSMALKRSSRSQ